MKFVDSLLGKYGTDDPDDIMTAPDVAAEGPIEDADVPDEVDDPCVINPGHELEGVDEDVECPDQDDMFIAYVSTSQVL